MLQIGELIRNKYTIAKELGLGRMSHTFLANDNESKKVVVKVIQLKGLPEWKILELFEREAQILKGISHPRIPKYIDYFKEEKDDNTIFYLIYEYIEGTSLSKVITTSYKLSYDDVKHILLQILDILDFLHSRFPPIIHRDINPNNIILDFNKNAYLVDFGASSILMYGEKEDGGSTFVGTYGYIPLEQMRGNPVPQSDLYALGMTAIKLLTGENPSKFPLKKLKPDYLENNLPNNIDKVIDKMIEMEVENRPKSAKEVIQLLTDENTQNIILNNPANNQVAINNRNLAYYPISQISMALGIVSSSISSLTLFFTVINSISKSINFITLPFFPVGLLFGIISLFNKIPEGKSRAAGIVGIVLSAISALIAILSLF